MTWWQYLLLVNIYLTLFFGFYELLLRRETFFQLNRVYLVGTALLSFLIPVIQADWVKNLFITKQVQYTLYRNPFVVTAFSPVKENAVTIGQVMVILYLTGAVFLALRFVWQLNKLKKGLYTPAPFEAYSFFKKVHLGEGIADKGEIIKHEQVHVRQWHSADVLVMEAVMIINWFNPVVYLYRYAVKRVHEFIADKQALGAGTDKAEYALLLLNQTFHTLSNPLVNPFFNHSLLKQRIMMLQKNRSQRIKLAKYGLSAPLFILMLVLSSATISNSKTVTVINKKTEQVFLQPVRSVITIDNPAFQSVEIKTGETAVKPEKQVAIQPQGTTRKEIQIDTVPKKNSPVFTLVEHAPVFPGGDQAFVQFLAKSVRYPAEARENKIQGRVIVTFVVEEDGSLSDMKVVRGIGGGADEEAVRALKASPRWIPGTQNGKTVRVQYSVPIAFALDNKKGEQKVGSTDTQIDKFIGVATANPVDTTNKPKPLYILDGKEIADLSKVNPSDIESIAVLKDKSATVLYGDKGVNGVVIVTLKKPKAKE